MRETGFHQRLLAALLRIGGAARGGQVRDQLDELLGVHARLERETRDAQGPQAPHKRDDAGIARFDGQAVHDQSVVFRNADVHPLRRAESGHETLKTALQPRNRNPVMDSVEIDVEKRRPERLGELQRRTALGWRVGGRLRRDGILLWILAHLRGSVQTRLLRVS